jgi:hypothetical protein
MTLFELQRRIFTVALGTTLVMFGVESQLESLMGPLRLQWRSGFIPLPHAENESDLMYFIQSFRMNMERE